MNYTVIWSHRFPRMAQWALRISLAATFLSAVADRFGVWGLPGSSNVAWGNWQIFSAYVSKLNWFLPVPLIQPTAWVATVAEVCLAIGLLIGWKLHWFAFASAALLLSFALTMTFAIGIKAPLDFSVFTAAAGALLLGVAASPKLPR